MENTGQCNVNRSVAAGRNKSWS